MENIQVHYFNGRRHTSKNFRSGRRLVQFLKTAEVVHLIGFATAFGFIRATR